MVMKGRWRSQHVAIKIFKGSDAGGATNELDKLLKLSHRRVLVLIGKPHSRARPHVGWCVLWLVYFVAVFRADPIMSSLTFVA